jgi:hypothetical protein
VSDGQNASSGKKLPLWLVLLVALPCLYAAAFWNSLRKIDDFCSSVTIGMQFSSLPTLARESGVDLRGPFEYPENSGQFVAISASFFTIGEYKCRIKSDASGVKSKYLGNI